MVSQSNAGMILVAIPMIVVLFAGFFRLDELISRPEKATVRRRRFSHWDEDGSTVTVEPDGRANRGFLRREKLG